MTELSRRTHPVNMFLFLAGLLVAFVGQTAEASGNGISTKAVSSRSSSGPVFWGGRCFSGHVVVVADTIVGTLSIQCDTLDGTPVSRSRGIKSFVLQRSLMNRATGQASASPEVSDSQIRAENRFADLRQRLRAVLLRLEHKALTVDQVSDSLSKVASLFPDLITSIRASSWSPKNTYIAVYRNSAEPVTSSLVLHPIVPPGGLPHHSPGALLAGRAEFLQEELDKGRAVILNRNGSTTIVPSKLVALLLTQMSEAKLGIASKSYRVVDNSTLSELIQTPQQIVED